MQLPSLRKRRQRSEITPSRSDWFDRDWFDRPWSSALELFERPFELLERPFRRMWKTALPSVDISETYSEVIVKAEVPGMTQEDLQVSYQEGVLTISGEKKEEKREEKKGGVYRESGYGSFSRDIPLGEDLRWDETAAHCKNGVLTVTIPKEKGAARKGAKIKIQ